MKYLSVCSGIEAASVAWHPLGWAPVGFSEIEPFPSAVLAHHYPTIPNYGDMTKHEHWPIEPGSIDILVGGTPCQSFSVAGLRQGLKDLRGNLMLTFLAIAARLRPRWIVWENVPGVLSSNGGRDFGSFLGGLGQLGYGFAYRVLDAQWCRTHGHPRAVPQRRRRVFVVGCLGNQRSAAKVLFERESVFRNPSPRRAAGQTVAGTIAARSGESRNNPEQLVAFDQQRQGQYGDGEVASTKAARDFKGANAMYPPHIEQTNVMDPLVARGPHAVAFTKSKRAQSTTDNETWVEGVVAPTQNAFDVGDVRATTVAIQGTVIGRQDHNGLQGAGHSESGEMFTLNSTDVHAVAFQQNTRDEVRLMNGDGQIAGALAAESGMKQQNYLASTTMQVRRLTPTECERLQGFPDDYTLIPWRKGLSPDGPRYKALGNSMAVNCMEWIGDRIAAVEARP